MYELTCPECGKVTHWPFVRLGAVRVCAECRHIYQIEKEHVRHRVRVASAAVNLDDDPEPTVRPSLELSQADTALMGDPAIVEDESQPGVDTMPSAEVAPGMGSAFGARPSGLTTASLSVEQPMSSATPMAAAPRTPGIVLWAGIALLGLGLMLLIFWMVGGHEEPPTIPGRPVVRQPLGR